MYWNRYGREETGELRSRMECFARDELFDYFEVTLHSRGPTCYMRYYFELDGDQVLYLTARGVRSEKPQRGWFEYLYTNERDLLSPPLWPQGRVFYQIFPDRFARGNPANCRAGLEHWEAAPTRENHFGGDLKGIIGHLDHLCALGIGALYLNPIFLSPSNHKYDTTDYSLVDGSLGTTADLKELVAECHRRDIRIILDGVFNHCGFSFPPFQDLLANGAASRYRDWFFVESFPVRTAPPNYECVGYYKWMPKLRTANREVQEYLLGIARLWIEQAGIDGWRLDVADEVESLFLQELRRHLKRINPEILLLGETWREAPDMLRGDQLDSVMNYPFAEFAADFFGRRTISPSEFDGRINWLLSLYPWETVSLLYNLLGSHDTPRFLHTCGEDAERFRLAVGFQMTFPGVPAVFYGDEVGMTGDTDPDCRRPMVWEAQRQNGEILAWYKRLITIRKSRASLSHGDYRTILCDDASGLYGFVRRFEGETTYVILNNGDIGRGAQVPLCDFAEGATYRDLLTGREYPGGPKAGRSRQGRAPIALLGINGVLSLPLAAKSLCILVRIAGEEDTLMQGHTSRKEGREGDDTGPGRTYMTPAAARGSQGKEERKKDK